VQTLEYPTGGGWVRVPFCWELCAPAWIICSVRVRARTTSFESVTFSMPVGPSLCARYDRAMEGKGVNRRRRAVSFGLIALSLLALLLPFASLTFGITDLATYRGCSW
jgi:hypothetical protein